MFFLKKSKAKTISLGIILCLIMGLFTVSAGSTGVKAGEGGSEYAVVTVIDYADQSKYSADSFEVAKDSSVLIAGGKNEWSFGFIIIEEKNGNHLDYVKNGESQMTVDTVSAALEAAAANGSSIPAGVTDYLDGNIPAENRSTTKAVIIEAFDFASVSQNPIEICFTGGGKITVNLMDYTYDDSITVNTGSDVDLFTATNLSGDLVLSKDDRSNYDIKKLNGGTNRYLTLTEGAEAGQYSTDGYGVLDFRITNKSTGLLFYVSLTVNGTAFDMALPRVTGANIKDDSNFTQFDYNLVPADGSAKIKNLTISFTLAPGAEISWNSNYSFCMLYGPLENVASKQYKDSRETFGDYTVNYKYTQNDRDVVFEFSVQDYWLTDYMTIGIEKDGKVQGYRFEMNETKSIDASFIGLYRETKPFIPGTTLDIFSFISVPAADRTKLVSGLDSGKYELEMPGGELLKENGTFKGKVILYRPMNTIGLTDMENKEVLASLGTTNIQARLKTVVRSGENVDLSKLISNYWNSSDWTVSSVPSGISSRTFTAPAVEGPVEYTISVKNTARSNMVEALIYMTVTPESSFSNTVNSIVGSLGDNDGLVYDANSEAPEIEGSIIDSLAGNKNSNKSNTVTIRNKQNSHDAEWIFSSTKLNGRSGNPNLKLQVKVDSEVKNEAIDELLSQKSASGVQVGFESNGALPGEVDVRIYLTGSEYAKLKNADHISLYYHNPSTGALEVQPGDYYLVHDPIKDKYYITISVTHNSDFVISSDSTLAPTPTPAPSPAPGFTPGGAFYPVPVDTPTATPTPTPSEAPETEKAPAEETETKVAVSEESTSFVQADGSELVIENDTLNSLLTEEEKEAVAAGAKVELAVAVEEKVMTEAETQAVSEAIAELEKTLDKNTDKDSEKNPNKNPDKELKVGSAYDINLTKKVGSGEAAEIHDLGGGKIDVSVPVSAADINTDKAVLRSYFMVHIFDNGLKEVLPAVFDILTGKVRFTTGGFSTYVLIYTDEPYTVPAGESVVSKKYNAKYEVISAGDANGKVGELKYIAPLKSRKSITVTSKVTIDGITYRVTVIGAKAFKNDKVIEQLTIGSNVAKIGKEAFRGCTSLKKAVLGKKVKSVGAKAFYGCKALEKIEMKTDRSILEKASVSKKTKVVVKKK